jgi:hypothetical protein
MENQNLTKIQRTIVIDAKRNLYAAFLSIPKESMTEYDIVLMAVLAKDNDIQDILNKSFENNKN